MHASTVASSFVSSRRMPMDASRMTESPPSASTIMGESAMPDGSYMVVRDVNDARDPYAMIEGLLDRLSRPVAFASVPLPSRTALPPKPRPAPEPSPSPPPDVVDSFLFVPSTPTKAAASSKTIEELTLENASLKASLDSITSQLHAINTERDQLRHSIADLGRGLRGVGAASSPLAQAAQPSLSRPEDLSRIAELESELDVARASAVKHKSRASAHAADPLTWQATRACALRIAAAELTNRRKDAIKRKRAAREAEAAAQAANGSASEP